VEQEGQPYDRDRIFPNLVGIDELADQLGTSSRHIRRLVAERRVPYLKMGSCVGFDPTDIAGWLERSRVSAPPGPTRRDRPTMRSGPLTWPDNLVDRERGTVTEQRRYADHRPYPDPPGSLTDLTGPTSGVVELPITIDWGPRRHYDLGADADRRIVYERVLREAAEAEEVCHYVNGAILVEEWPRVWLPQRVRRAWEQRFPELTHAV
jgi:excisionase family DNA binding protein